jgi:hypothetical protein
LLLRRLAIESESERAFTVQESYWSVVAAYRCDPSSAIVPMPKGLIAANELTSNRFQLSNRSQRINKHGFLRPIHAIIVASISLLIDAATGSWPETLAGNV